MCGDSSFIPIGKQFWKLTIPIKRPKREGIRFKPNIYSIYTFKRIKYREQIFDENVVSLMRAFTEHSMNINLRVALKLHFC